MRAGAPRAVGALAAVLAATAVIAVGRGAVPIAPLEVLAALGARLGLPVEAASAQQAAILWEVRLPRVALALLVGAALGAAGAALQGVVRNPLADPAVVGVSSGAALGAVMAIVLGAPLLTSPAAGRWLIPAAAFGGALLAAAAALRLARVDGRVSGVSLVVGGIGIAALAGAALGLVVSMADDAALRSITFWSLGSVGGATWPVVGAVAVPVVVALALLPRLAPALDRLALGEAEARHVGVEVTAAARAVVVLSALAVGAAVAATGIIGFVGLVVPALGRAWVGPGHRALLPACALGGALLVVLADLVARTVVVPAELPVGVVTALVGAPVLLALLRQGRAADVSP
jgi:iron complex transport system permease protein